jgi:hypothetical protein
MRAVWRVEDCVSASVISARRGDLPSLGFGGLDTSSHLTSFAYICSVSTTEPSKQYCTVYELAIDIARAGGMDA